MRRLIMLVLCVFMLTTAVFAENTASKVENFCVLSADGGCQVSMSVTIRIETGDPNLSFPLPKGATNVILNGASVRTYKNPVDANTVLVDLSYLNNAVGEYTLSFQYQLPSVVENVKTHHELTLPLLSGFQFPIEQMQFTVTLPGPVSVTPKFSSGYLQQSIESSIELVVNENMVSGVLNTPLQDHETLTMMMDAPLEMFNTQVITHREGNPEIMMMAACAVLALIYWLLTMRAMPLFPQDRIEPLEGITAGELGCHLSLTGIDFTALVITWAQLGYLRLELDRRGRVFLHKRMDMGNERDAIERQLFKSLFARGRLVDGTGLHYAKLAHKAAHMRSGEILKKGFSEVRIFRFLVAAISLLSGVCLAMNLTEDLSFQVPLAILLGVLGFITALRIQNIASQIFLRNKMPVYIGLGCTTAWILLGVFTGYPAITAAAAAAQLIAGFAMAYGGRRTNQARQDARLILGLRHYFKVASTQELHRIMMQNPNYFFEMAPYALALGVDKTFAKRFGKLPQPQCPYLDASIEVRLNTEEWAMLLRETASILDARHKQMQLQKSLPWLSKPQKPEPRRRPGGDRRRNRPNDRRRR